MHTAVKVKRPTEPASPAQINYLRALLDKHEVPADDRARLINKIDTGALDKGTASLSIQYLKARPLATVTAEGAGTAIGVSTRRPRVQRPGIFEHDGKIFRVKYNRSKTHLYAGVLSMTPGEAVRLTAAGVKVKSEYLYEPGAMNFLSEDDRVTGERAEELSIVFNSCIVCGRHLKDAESVKRGIGPVCRKSV